MYVFCLGQTKTHGSPTVPRLRYNRFGPDPRTANLPLLITNIPASQRCQMSIYEAPLPNAAATYVCRRAEPLVSDISMEFVNLI